MPQVLSDRMTLSESIEAVGRIVSCYPNGGSNADKAYIGALAFALSRYPRVIAERCADPRSGIVTVCKFLPTVPEITEWCDARSKPLWADVLRQRRITAQLAERKQLKREDRPTYEQLKAKYGENWGIDSDIA